MLKRRGLMRYLWNFCFHLFLILFLVGCNLPLTATPDPDSLSTIYTEYFTTITPGLDENPQINASNTPAPVSELPESSIQTTQASPPSLFLHPGFSTDFLGQIDLTLWNITPDESTSDAHLQLGPIEGSSRNNSIVWVYVVVMPFYNIRDEISFDELSALWRGEAVEGFQGKSIFLSQETKFAIQTLLGKPDENYVRVVTNSELEAIALSSSHDFAILPFEALKPQWKTLRIEGQSPIDDNFIPENYPLSLLIWFEGTEKSQEIALPPSNYDPNKRSVLLMTGVTALTRATANRMEVHGNTYPGIDIQSIMQSADITHISNEVPFTNQCPYPDPNQKDLVFCSNPKYIELLEFIGTDIIELSGNHLLDYGTPAIKDTLDMYDELGWKYYAGGRDLLDAQSPALVDHHGNRFAFLGCNLIGPGKVWATDSQPGAAACGDFSWMIDQIQQLTDQGFLPIVTLQYIEDYTAYPSEQMVSHFHDLAQAGAVVVNGSQAHTPKIMVFEDESFLHYGLGNLFFDQMEIYYNDTYLPGTRDEFLDRLVFYDGRLIGVELLTAKLEDYARPRPMTLDEREAFLSRIFQYAPLP
jgi:poly-gamma-glutamate synthesis protein (capsule biosynthesis protein)